MTGFWGLAMKVYIIGEMPNCMDGTISVSPDEYDHYQRAAIRLRMAGHTVVSPMVLPDGLSHDDYVHLCYSLIDISEAVLFLDGWESSESVRWIYRYACHTGKKILYEKENVNA